MDAGRKIVNDIFVKHPRCQRDLIDFQVSINEILDIDQQKCFCVGWVLGRKDNSYAE